MEQIRRLRNEKGLSQAKLAVRADMDPATLNRLEQGKGNPNLKTLERVAEALGVEVADLLGKARRPPSREPSLFNGFEEGHNLEVSFWIECLNAQAALCEQIIGHGGYDFQTLWNLEGAALELWGSYAKTIRRLVHEWCPPNRAADLQNAEARMKAARTATREAYRTRREAEQDREIVDELEERRRLRDERHADYDHADTGA